MSDPRCDRTFSYGGARSLGALGVLCALLLLICGPRAMAQDTCEGDWIPGVGLPGANGPVRAMTMWDPDGNGPRPPLLIATGSFSAIGRVAANNIAAWDGSRWSALGTGLTLSGSIYATGYALLVMPDGDLVVGGNFGVAGGVPAQYVARWNGERWSALTNVMNPTWWSGGVRALAMLPNGDLIAGGNFLGMGGVVAGGVARWDGAAWSAVGGGVEGWSQIVHALAVRPNGTLVAGGSFGRIGGTTTPNIAAWNGAAWVPLSAGLDGAVFALTVMPNGDVVAGGEFTNSGTAGLRRIARWNGFNWAGLGNGMTVYNDPARSAPVYGLTVLPDGRLVAVGSFQTAGFTISTGVAIWNGLGWFRPIEEFWGFAMGVYCAAVLANGDLAIGGAFSRSTGEGRVATASFGDRAWYGMGEPGFHSSSTSDPIVGAIAVGPAGETIIGGAFTSIAGTRVNRIARRFGDVWEPMGSGLMNGAYPDSSAWVWAITTTSDGNIVAGGQFTVAGGEPAECIARWDGSRWRGLGGGLTGSPTTGGRSRVLALAAFPDGGLFAGGEFTTAGGVEANGIARWDGTEWHALDSGIGGTVMAMAALPDGGLAVGGVIATAGGVSVRNIALWDGRAWSAMGEGFDGRVLAMTVRRDGSLIAAGEVTMVSRDAYDHYVKRWLPEENRWEVITSGIRSSSSGLTIASLAEAPNGDLLAAIRYGSVDGRSLECIARWDGVSWSPLGGGVTGLDSGSSYISVNAVVNSVVMLPNGHIGIGGQFDRAGSHVSSQFAEWAQMWPARLHAQPAATDTCPGGRAIFRVAAMGEGISLRWQREAEPDVFVDLSDGPTDAWDGGVEGIGAIVSGAGSDTLMIAADRDRGRRLGTAHAIRYRCVVTDACGELGSQAAGLSLATPCVADFNCDGGVDGRDVEGFFVAWAAGEREADVNGDGGLDGDDVAWFYAVWETGGCS